MKCLLIDGNSLINRAFYALPVLSTDEGVYTNAVYGFLKMFYKLVEEYTPDHIVCAFDVKHPTFRHERYAAYKAGRKPMPEELAPQIPLLKDVLARLGVFCFSLAGFEADDIVGTYARLAGENGGEAVILTGDRDAFQLIDAHTSVWFTKKGITDLAKLTPDNLKEHYGVRPDQVVDLKALMGDSSDNIPGIAGVGEKTALTLMEKYGSLDNLLAHADEVPGKLGEKIRAGREDALESRFLATIVRTVPVAPLENARYCPPDAETAAELFRKYQFRSLLKDTDAPAPEFRPETKPFDGFTMTGDTLGLAWTDKEITVACDEQTQYVLPLSV
ncbi:MAG: DNA polymerase I, partial [Clostridia bacterium]|nr:DNA polymerase I [Clostridia bacterium]